MSSVVRCRAKIFKGACPWIDLYGIAHVHPLQGPASEPVHNNDPVVELVGPLLPNNPVAAPATLASEHSEKGPDACEEELEAGMYDRIGCRTGKEREAHPPTQSYSKLLTIKLLVGTSSSL